MGVRYNRHGGVLLGVKVFTFVEIQPARFPSHAHDQSSVAASNVVHADVFHLVPWPTVSLLLWCLEPKTVTMRHLQRH